MKDVFYGGVTALMDNKQYYYKSGVGPDYDHWTEDGKPHTLPDIDQNVAYVTMLATDEDFEILTH